MTRTMIYSIFAQESGSLPFDKLAAHGARFFSTTLELLEPGDDTVALRLTCSRPSLRGEFRLSARAVNKDDLSNARDAEARGRAAGMAALAERCTQLWAIEARGSEVPIEPVFLTLAAICASVALGPVLPPDGSTLFGVRGAIERRDKALA